MRARYRMVEGIFGPWLADHLITAAAVVEYDTITGLPTKLGDISPGEGDKLTGIDDGATKGAPAGTNVGGRPAETVISDLDKALAKINGSTYFDTDAPPVPTGLALASSLTDIGADFRATWTASTTVGVRYIIAIKQGSGNYVENGADSATFYAPTVPRGQTITAKVLAIKNNVKSGYSPEVSISTAKDAIAPALPTGLSVATTYNGATLSWTNASDTDLDTIEIWRGASSDSTLAVKIDAVNAVPGQPGRYIATGLTQATAYYFWLKSVDTSGNASALTNPVSATTAGGIVASDFVDGLSPVTTVTALPSVTGYAGTPLVMFNKELYRIVNGAWTKSVNGADISTGTITGAALVPTTSLPATISVANVTGANTIGDAFTRADWTKIVGAGKPADNATADVSFSYNGLLPASNIVITGNRLTKVGATSDWSTPTTSGDVVTPIQRFPGGMRFSWRGTYASYALAVGLLIGTNRYLDSLLFSIRTSGNIANFYIGTTQDGTGVTYDGNTVFEIAYDNVNVYLRTDGVTRRTYPVASGLNYVPHCHFKDFGAAMSDISFTTYTDNAWNSVGGAGRPDDFATSGENMLPNASLLTNTNGWTLAGALTRVQAVAGDPGNYFHATANNASPRSATFPLTSGITKLFISYWKRAQIAGQQIAFDIGFQNGAGTVTGYRFNSFVGAANTWTMVKESIAVPSDAVTMNIAPVLVVSGTYHDIADIRLSAVESAATVGAPTGTLVGGTLSETIELRANDPATRINQNTVTIDGGKLTAGTVTTNQLAAGSITADRIAAGAIVIGSDGKLGGAGSGQVSLPGLGYTGALDATRGAPAGTLVGATYAQTLDSRVTSGLMFADTRTVDSPPSFYYGQYGTTRIVTEFKNLANIGLTAVGGYGGLTTSVQWGDPSGGPVHQEVRDSYGRYWNRISTSTTAWGGWIDTGAQINSGITTINGGKITTNSVTALQIAANTITSDQIAARSIVAADLVANTITGNEIAASTITANQIAGRTIVASNLAANTITSNEIAADTITANQIAANTITGNEIATNAITADKVLANSITANKLVLATRPFSTIGMNIRVDADNVVRWDGGFLQYVDDNGNYTSWAIAAGVAGYTNAPFYFLWNTKTKPNRLDWTTDYNVAFNGDYKNIATWNGGSDLVVNAGVGTSINGDRIVTGTVNANKLTARSITANQIASGAITANEISAGTITTAQLAAGAITATKLAVGSSDSIIPDNDFRDAAFWTTGNTIANVVPTNAAWPSSANILSVAGDNTTKDWSTPFFNVEAGATYRIRVWFFANQDFVGSMNPVIHMPNVQWLSLKTGVGSNPDAVDGNSVTAPTSGVIFKEIVVTNSYDCHSWQFRFKGTHKGYFQFYSSIVRVSDTTLIADGAITTNKITVGSLNGDRITANTLDANTIRAGSVISNFVQVANTGLGASFDLGSIALSANSPADRINTMATTIQPGKISIGGGGTLNNWKNGADSTEIRGGAIAANTIKANSLMIGARDITVIGCDFQWRDGALRWSDGYILWTGNDGNPTSVTISAGAVGWQNQLTYVFWGQGRTYFDVGVDWSLGKGGDFIIMCTWRGGANFVANYGGTIVDGDRITTSSIQANKLSVGSLSAISANIGSLVSYNGAGGRVERDGNGTRVYYNNGNLAVKIGF
ncbi:fibronectin type III domain-containing protein [Sphingomonas sp. Leaf242]|uniref:fibronectin type III domain-containing protein n=1 Tax=Sphingomonas sp. Leaf242 TaxID=1736304 RepID=UPI0012E0FBD1|nr:fibronectin type III domain-containing protein [Sphingomonas sp. Leaf242]